MEQWSIGVSKTFGADTLHRSSIEDGVGKPVLTFKTLSPILSHSSIPPVLQHSIPPFLHHFINAGIRGSTAGLFLGLLNVFQKKDY
jgi:hypothetical protein